MGLLDDKLNEIRTMRESESVELERAKPKPRYRVRNGKVVMRMAAVLAEPKPASNIRKVAFRAKLRREADTEQRSPRHLVAGGRCPKCKGGGWWTHPDTGHKDVCYWCNDPRKNGGGKGYLNKRDIQFIQARDNGAGALNCGLTA